MKNFVLGGLVSYLIIYSSGSTYLLYKGGYRYVRCRWIFFNTIYKYFTIYDLFYFNYEFSLWVIVWRYEIMDKESYIELYLKYKKLLEKYIKLEEKYNKLINSIDEDFWNEYQDLLTQLWEW